MTPLSIITPTLNAAAYLERCLASVQAQRVTGLQHLLIDGGSTDATAEIARHYPGVEWLLRLASTQSQAINEGLRWSTGEIITWLNADDLYLADTLEFVVEQFRSHPRLDVLYGDCEVIGPHDEHLWSERPGAYDFRRLFRRGNYIAQPSVFLRRRVFDDIGYLDESLEYAMDYDLWLRVRGRNIIYVPRPLACFRWHPRSKTARGQLQGWHELLRVLRKHGGGWTPELAWAFARLLVTFGRTRLEYALTGSTRLKPLRRGPA